ncbi:YeeE/YedE family protein [Fodinicurvata sediminis]|uniref:YeeE/YedE family protein n=1 Tax=Fodinicurvata sediminis TaxID=1121832 RepID=UPI0003B6AC69|nr:YeeE/YedE family protein [Fodinicurvata sediminis]
MSNITLGGAGDFVAPLRAVDLRIVTSGLALLLLGIIFLNEVIDGRQAWLFLVGGALGLVLYHALFGFTSAFRVFFSDRRGAGLRAQMIMLALACVLFFPVLASGDLFGREVSGFIAPVGISVVIGAFLFGLGMQLGGGCASGTLFTVGGGSTRMVITLLGFVAGSVLGAYHLPWWQEQPAFQPVSLIGSFGWLPALIANLAVFVAIYLGTIWLEKRRHGKLLEGADGQARGWQRFLRGPWPLVWGAVALAFLNFITLALAGRPWGITSAFALWGSKALAAGGVDVASWGYWSSAGRAASLEQTVFSDITSVMNFGIIIGAFLAAGLAGKFAPIWKLPRRSVVAAIVGGLLLGYGARLAFGCNIGAYFSGIASGSLHGWVWIVAALAGNWLGMRLRPWFGLVVERTPQNSA